MSASPTEDSPGIPQTSHRVKVDWLDSASIILHEAFAPLPTSLGISWQVSSWSISHLSCPLHVLQRGVHPHWFVLSSLPSTLKIRNSHIRQYSQFLTPWASTFTSIASLEDPWATGTQPRKFKADLKIRITAAGDGVKEKLELLKLARRVRLLIDHRCEPNDYTVWTERVVLRPK